MLTVKQGALTGKGTQEHIGVQELFHGNTQAIEK